MKNWFIAGVLLLTLNQSKAQSFDLADKGCGTITTQEEMQEVAEYVANSANLKKKTTAGVDSIPLTIHMVSKSDGSGRYRLDYLFTVLCELNTRYAPVGFYFYVKPPIRFIKNSSYYDHNYSSGYQMMGQHNVANSVNIYFVNDPAGACGYFSPSTDGIAIGKACSNPNSTTLVHEIGHYFGLPHTFSGWENGNTPSNPEKVTRGAGANCSSAGDLFCDTDADYLGSRWNCPYTGFKLDVNGDPYHPDSSLYMSYAEDACMTRFSGQQIGRMQSKLINNRSYLLLGNPTGSSVLNTPVNVVYPSDTLYSNAKNIRWNKVPGADFYYVKAGFQIGSSIKQDTVVSDTSFSINFPMVDGGNYSVTITPMSSINVCGTNSLKKNFVYSSGTTLSVDQIAGQSGKIALYPNPAQNTVTLNLETLPSGNYQVQMTNINGQKVYEQAVRQHGGNGQVSIATAALPNGIYMVRVTGDKGNWFEKLVIQH